MIKGEGQGAYLVQLLADALVPLLLVDEFVWKQAAFIRFFHPASGYRLLDTISTHK
jgi:hypothetical protein